MKPGRRNASASDRLIWSVFQFKSKCPVLNFNLQMLAHIISSEHCLSSLADTEEATKAETRATEEKWYRARLGQSLLESVREEQVSLVRRTGCNDETASKRTILLFNRCANVMMCTQLQTCFSRLLSHCDGGQSSFPFGMRLGHLQNDTLTFYIIRPTSSLLKAANGS